MENVTRTYTIQGHRRQITAQKRVENRNKSTSTSTQGTRTHDIYIYKVEKFVFLE
jgi:hypothetical protein